VLRADAHAFAELFHRNNGFHDGLPIHEGRMVREQPARPPPYPADKARGGEVILRRPWQRAVFIFGLALPVALGLLMLVLYR